MSSCLNKNANNVFHQETCNVGTISCVPTETVDQSCFAKCFLEKVWKNSQENNCVGASFKKGGRLETALFFKKDYNTVGFQVIFKFHSSNREISLTSTSSIMTD